MTSIKGREKEREKGKGKGKGKRERDRTLSSFWRSPELYSQILLWDPRLRLWNLDGPCWVPLRIRPLGQNLHVEGDLLVGPENVSLWGSELLETFVNLVGVSIIDDGKHWKAREKTRESWCQHEGTKGQKRTKKKRKEKKKKEVLTRAKMEGHERKRRS